MTCAQAQTVVQSWVGMGGSQAWPSGMREALELLAGHRVRDCMLCSDDVELPDEVLARWTTCSRNEAIRQAEASHAEVMRLHDTINKLHIRYGPRLEDAEQQRNRAQERYADVRQALGPDVTEEPLALQVTRLRLRAFDAGTTTATQSQEGVASQAEVAMASRDGYAAGFEAGQKAERSAWFAANSVVERSAGGDRHG